MTKPNMSMDRKTGANGAPIAGAPGPHPVGAATSVDTRQFAPVRGLRDEKPVTFDVVFPPLRDQHPLN